MQIATQHNLIMRQLDIKSAYLNVLTKSYIWSKQKVSR